MTTIVFGVVLFAAALHATWNAIIKAGTDTFLTTVLVTAFSAFWAVPLLPFLPMPHVSSWPYIFVSAILQIIYFILVARTYRVADMSQTYPLMRGTAPIIVALFGTFFLEEKLAFFTWVGVIIICTGILINLKKINSNNQKGIKIALLNAFIIAGYTLVDGKGVRVSGSAIAYTLWIFLLTGLSILIWALINHYERLKNYTPNNWHLGMIGGIGTIASYALALWAMTIAPIAIIAALRESSILFATLISLFMLKEKISRTRILSSVIIVIGAFFLRLSY